MSKITHVVGDLFASPSNTILVHACNTLGSWGSGIAVAFREKYPAQYEKYRAHCKQHGDALAGTCLLLPGEDHDIACLFTSRAYGKRKDTPEQILQATRTAVQDLMNQNVHNKPLHACRFNSGKFAVPWERTEAVLNNLGVSMVVYTPQ
ncbi:hypothetical protein D9613_005983 [Agrocybe pediades]|uniref:ADP-ribose 1''-phosphate phosphatase n=1 Tax=Agrocybe pediades TaxID=84607 RepID=A0A8H4QWW5_9AGAR|nr:hypothetical protein D9613_005983 [Agrocybe pediades]KAF9561305.1 hypothetical protein CPC08DRAFT_664415 [Agrocybe pediades]